MIIKNDIHEYRICFSKGHISAASSPLGGALFRALCWLRLLKPEQVSHFLSGDPTDMDNEDLAEILISQNIATLDAIRDGIESYIEEAVTDALSWNKPDMQFIIDGDTNVWEKYQIDVETSLPASSVLMEGLRRQDELSRFSHLECKGNDLLIAENMSEDVEEQIEDLGRELWDTWQEGLTIDENITHCRIPPWQGQRTLFLLQHQGLLRVPTAAELIVLANNLGDNDHQHKELLLRKAVELGAGNANIFLSLAKLSITCKDTAHASQDYLSAASSLETQFPDKAIAVLHKVIDLGIQKESALRQLILIYRTTNNASELAQVLLLNGQNSQKLGKIEDVIQSISEAKELGADVFTCEQILADCAIKQFDKEQALLHLDLAAKTAIESGKYEDGIAILQQMLGISPGHITAAIAYTEYLFENEQNEAAKTIIEQALSDTRSKHADEELLPLRQLLTRVDPDDAANHDWLAMYFQEREDRVAASAQLLKLAEAQEKDQKFQELTLTLDRILELAGQQVPLLIKQARLQTTLGLDSRSIRNWDSAIKKLIQQDDLDQAQLICEEALESYPGRNELHINQAKISNKNGDRLTAIHHFRRAAYLAHGAGQLDLARKIIAQLLVLQPDDVLMRCQLADIANESPHENDDDILHDLIRVAIKSKNTGLALERARQRVTNVDQPSFRARSDLIELLRRTGNNQEEKHEGLLLFQAYIDAGEYNDALQLLERLVASSGGQDSHLVHQLAELYEGLERKRQAIRYYRHAVVLFQQEENYTDAEETLQQLMRLTDNAADVTNAHALLSAHQAINWESIGNDIQSQKSGSKSYNRSESTIMRSPAEKNDH